MKNDAAVSDGVAPGEEPADDGAVPAVEESRSYWFEVAVRIEATSQEAAFLELHEAMSSVGSKCDIFPA